MIDRSLRRLPWAIAAALACASYAKADTTFDDGKIHLSGFGTVGLSTTSTNEAEFNYPGQGGGSTRSDPSFNPDSKLGLQGTYQFLPTVSATLQALTKYQAQGQYRTEIEWAFVKWQALPALTVRGGRIGTPYFMVSDFRDVGYANTTVRPPLDVYGQVPLSHTDGGDVSYQTNLGSATLTGTVFAGDSQAYYTTSMATTSFNTTTSLVPIDVSLHRQMGLNLQAEFDEGYSLRFGTSRGRLSLNTPANAAFDGASNQVAALAGGFGDNISTQVAALQNAIVTQNAKASFSGFGASMDRDNIVASAEYTWRKVGQGTVTNTTGWYLNGGYRFGSWLPYVGVSELSVKHINTSISATHGVNPYAADPFLSTVYAAAQQFVQQDIIKQNTISLGVRWDVHPGLAVKAQFDRVNKPANSEGTFLVSDYGSTVGKNFYDNKQVIDVATVALDFVF